MRCWVSVILIANVLPLLAQTDSGNADSARKTVERYLETVKGTSAAVSIVSDPAVDRFFPQAVFVVVRFRQFPVARQLPVGLEASNLFRVTKKGELFHVKDSATLTKLFKDEAAAVEHVDTARDALAGWLNLAQEFHQDGFYRFEIDKKTFTIEKTGEDVIATGRAVAMQGGNGALEATMKFTKGKLVQVTETAKLRPGPRPICQATKLLDTDPIVRRMAENDLLYIGDLAKDYLDEQRARASVELQQAIDGIWRRIQESNSSQP